jgi:hypothetical protein
MEAGPDRDSPQDRIVALAGLENESTMQLSLTAFAVDHTGCRIAALGRHRDRLAPKIDIPVSVTGEDSVQKLDGIPGRGAIDSRLDGRDVSQSIGMNHPGSGQNRGRREAASGDDPNHI